MISNEYKTVLSETHSKYPKWGTSARKHIGEIKHLIEIIDPGYVLDYGCGKGMLGILLQNTIQENAITFIEYDPGIEGKDTKPSGKFDLVVCLDVMEHVEEEHLRSVMEHLQSVVGMAGYFLISTKHAHGVLSDGRNAHLTVKSAGWWRELFEEYFPNVDTLVNNRLSEVYIAVSTEDYDGELQARGR